MKIQGYQWLFVLSAILLAAFAVFTGLDYIAYQDSFTSAPFSVFVLIRAIEFVLPAILVSLVGLIVKMRRK